MNAMAPNLHQLWVYLAASPLFGLITALIAYLTGVCLHERSRLSPTVNLLLIVVVILGTLLIVTDTLYETYFDGAQLVHLLLGSATVALAMPLFQQWVKLRRHAVPLMAGLLAGSVVAVVLTVGIVRLLGAPSEALRPMAPESVMIPIAMDVPGEIGGAPAITAVLVLITDIVGMTTTTQPPDLLHVREYSVHGSAANITAYGIGTARVFQVNSKAGVFSALGMGLSGVLTAALMPLLAGRIPH